MAEEIIARELTQNEVKLLIKNKVTELLREVVGLHNAELISAMKKWAQKNISEVETDIIAEIRHRHVQGVTFAVWAGPPGAGKGTNIATLGYISRAYAEYSSQGNANILPEPQHSFLLRHSLSQASINTGTGGMFNMPVGEYEELFGPLKELIGEHVASGGFVADNIVSLMVEMMILLRLSQGYHRIQIDLWPRTGSQFRAYQRFINKLLAAECKISQELVSLRVLPDADLEEIKKAPEIASAESYRIGEFLHGVVESEEYKEHKMRAVAMTSSLQARYDFEKEYFDSILQQVEKTCDSPVSKALFVELATVSGRMAFRFAKAIEVGEKPRVDEFPMSLLRRLSIYLKETSPEYLRAAAGIERGFDVAIASTMGTPDFVIERLLDALVGEESLSPQWIEFKSLAGKIANELVNRKEPIAEELQEAIGGILSS